MKIFFIRAFRFVPLNSFVVKKFKDMLLEAPVKFKDEWAGVLQKFEVYDCEDVLVFDVRKDVVDTMLSDMVVLDKNNHLFSKMISVMVKNLRGERLRPNKDYRIDINYSEVVFE